MKKIIMVALTCLVSACQRTDTPEVEKKQTEPTIASVSKQTKIDLSTPDRALKSYWAVNDEMRRGTRDLVTENEQRHIDKLKELGFDAEKILTGEALLAALSEEKISPLIVEEYDREITDVKQETESRAIVFVNIKNSTPIPPNVAISDDDLKRRNTPDKYKYLLEKDSVGWKVSQVYTYDDFFAKYGGDGNPWKPVLSKKEPDSGVRSFVTPVHN